MTKNIAASTTASARAHVYRSDIDGLRAVAVLSVVFYHAFPALLPGGFVGVDIFFVISGYLITGIVLADLSARRFSLATFYVRRIRRIFPALATVLLATYAIAWFCLTDDEYKQLGKHMLAGAGFVSNWALWTEAGYFDQTASAKPLLHLWSLGVEEQFYIVWPLLLAAAVSFRRVRWFCAGIGAASFLMNLALVRHHAPAAFYWPMPRMWELLAGAALAIGSRSLASGTRRERSTHALSVAGVLLCAISFLALNASLAFPGGWAALPVLGAVALIAAGQAGWVNQRVLSHPVAVRIGKISYALYLWHWPLLSFAFILAGNEPPAATRAAIVMISVALAWLTTAFIERPVRFGASARWKWIVPCLLMVGIGYLGGRARTHGAPAALPTYSPDADVATARLGASRVFVSGTCGVSPANQQLFYFCATDRRAPSHYAVWGDSKADALYWGLVSASAPGESWTLIARPSCAPMTGVARLSFAFGDNPAECKASNEVALRMLLGNPALTTVVLVASERDVIGQPFATAGQATPSPTAALDGLDNDVTSLERAGKRVALVFDNPILPDPLQCMYRQPLASSFMRAVLGVSAVSANERCAISYDRHLKRMAAYRTLIDELQRRHPELLVYDPARVLCDAKHNVCPMTMHGAYLYSYGDHVSDTGSSLIAHQFLPILHGAIARPMTR
jgi:peptidoglycan/LPS O-acetylase OafA/YrhL